MPAQDQYQHCMTAQSALFQNFPRIANICYLTYMQINYPTNFLGADYASSDEES